MGAEPVLVASTDGVERLETAHNKSRGFSRNRQRKVKTGRSFAKRENPGGEFWDRILGGGKTEKKKKKQQRKRVFGHLRGGGKNTREGDGAQEKNRGAICY